MFSADKIPDQLGHLILKDDGAIISSAGELENNEHVAEVIYNMLSMIDRMDSEPYHSLSVIYNEGHGYVVTISNKKIYIVKRLFKPPTQIEVTEEVPNSMEETSAPPVSSSIESS